ncbi:hypothetical protein MauCBS54593_000184 [Microsporum audouinii]
MSAIRRYLTAEKTALIMEWVDTVNSQPCIGMTVREPSKAAKRTDITSSAAIPPKAGMGRPPKYKQLTLKSTKLRRVSVVPRGSRQQDEQKEEKAADGEEEHVNEENGIAQMETKYGEEMKDKEVKEEKSEQAMPRNPIPSVVESNLRMFCVEIVIPSSGKHNSRDKEASGDNQAESEKRKRGATKGRGRRTKHPKLAVEKG